MDWILIYYLRLMANELLLNFRANVLKTLIYSQTVEWNMFAYSPWSGTVYKLLTACGHSTVQ